MEKQFVKYGVKKHEHIHIMISARKRIYKMIMDMHRPFNQSELHTIMCSLASKEGVSLQIVKNIVDMMVVTKELIIIDDTIKKEGDVIG